MKLLINNKYEEIGFWSFVKCNLIVELVLAGILYLLIFLTAFIVGLT